MLKKTIILFTAGALTGLCAALIRAVSETVSHKYVYYTLYRLIYETFRSECLTWMSAMSFSFVIAGLCLSALFSFFGGFRSLPVSSGFRKAVSLTTGILLISLCVFGAVYFFSDRDSRFFIGIGAPVFFVTMFRIGKLCSLRPGYVYCAALCFIVFLSALLLVPAHRIDEHKTNVVMIVIDCLRSDHLGCYGYRRNISPAIDSLAEQGCRFTRAYANAPWTQPSVASLFTSLPPGLHNVINGYSSLPDASLTVAEILKNNGYETACFNGGNEFIHPRYNFDQGFDRYVFRSRETYNALHITDDFTRYLDRKKRGPFFAYLHYMDAHTPYTKNPYSLLYVRQADPRFMPGSDQFRLVRLLTAQKRLPESTKQHIINIYDGQIKCIDHCIGIIRTALEQAGMLDNTFLIITADHGEELWDHGNFEHGHSLYGELLHVPLIISGPGIRSAAVEQTVRLLDMTPTIVDLSGASVSSSVPFRGTSLRPLLKGNAAPRELPVFASGTLYGPERFSVQKGAYKLILNTNIKHKKWNLIGPHNPAKTELYNIRQDPQEQHPVKNNHVKETLQNMLDGHRKQKPLYDPADSSESISPEIKEKLEALGYIR